MLNCGPVGLMPQKFAWMKNAKRVIAVDYLDYRITYAKKISNAGVFEFRNYPNMGNGCGHGWKEITFGVF